MGRCLTLLRLIVAQPGKGSHELSAGNSALCDPDGHDLKHLFGTNSKELRGKKPLADYVASNQHELEIAIRELR